MTLKRPLLKISKKIQVAAIMMNKNGEIKAMMGGRVYSHSQFNRAVVAKHQSGSIFQIIRLFNSFRK
ncbi:MAG: hypothetical protein MTP17_00080 [Candidatus Midichloria sp.]|nr:MAG: hypothetical protein MTP17_00080 [Candidatus Midichloria sp.]